MFEQDRGKSLIIVHGDFTTRPANYMLQLLESEKCSVNVEAAVWTRKQYKDNKPQLSSKNYVVFMGGNPQSIPERDNMNYVYDKGGMRIGYRGRRAVMYVKDAIITHGDYDIALEESKKYDLPVKDIRLVNLTGTALAKFGKKVPMQLPMRLAVMKYQYECMVAIFCVDVLPMFVGEK